MLSPDGGGGWDAARRAQERRRAAQVLGAPRSEDTGSTVAAPPAPASLATEDSGEPTHPAATSGAAIDLAEALAFARRFSRELALADAALEVAEADTRIARAALLPSASLRTRYSWYAHEQSNRVELPPDLLPPGSDPPVVTIRESDFVTASAAIRLALDLSGELGRAHDAATASYRAEKARRYAARLLEETEVVGAYLGLLEAESLAEVAAQTALLHQRQLEDAEAMFAEGRLTKNGVLVVRVALSSSRQLVLAAKTTVDARRRDLNRRIGLAVDAPTRVLDLRRRPPAIDADEAAGRAATDNPLLQAMLEEVVAADARASSLRRSRLPRFRADVGYDATSADVFEPSRDATAGVGVEWDLASLAREGEIAKADAALRRARIAYDRSAREVEALVRGACDQLGERLAAIETARVGVAQAEENLRIRQAQFAAGRATSEDLLDAEALLTVQRAAFASATYQAQARRAQTLQLMGLSPADEESGS